MRKTWLIFFLIGVAMEFFALLIERQTLFSCASLGFSYAVYHSCYLRQKTALLTLLIWLYSALFISVAAIGGCLFYLGAASFVRQLNLLSVATGGLCSLYVLTYFYLTVQLRRHNLGLSTD